MICVGITLSVDGYYIELEHHIDDGTRGQYGGSNPYRLDDIIDTGVVGGWTTLKTGDGLFYIPYSIRVKTNTYFGIYEGETLEFKPYIVENKIQSFIFDKLLESDIVTQEIDSIIKKEKIQSRIYKFKIS